MKAQAGDKVRIRKNGHPGPRGIVVRAEKAILIVCLEDSNETVEVSPSEVTNFSMAARKAWVSMPDRQVGRKKGVRLCDRISVTLRIDRELWERFQADEKAGLIDDRTETVNAWLKDKLDALERDRVQDSCQSE